MANEPQHLEHTIEAFCPEMAEVLILGTFPSPKSRETGFYYGHPQNRFWKVLAGIFNDKVPGTIDEKKDFLTEHHIALWDVLASCVITGASDASIKKPIANDLRILLKKAPIKYIYTTGKKAGDLYKRHWKDSLPVPMICLPSTSPANCRINLEELIEAYQPIAQNVMEDIG